MEVAKQRSSPLPAYARGGPRRTRLGALRLRQQWQVAVAYGLVAWVPLLIASLVESSAWGWRGSFVNDVGMHLRFLLALPLAVWAERPVERRLRRALEYLERAELIDDSNRAVALRAIARARRLLQLPGLELTLAIGAVALSALDPADGSSVATWSSAREGDPTAVSVAGWIYLLLSAPLARFVALLWVWRFCAWCVALVGLALSRLALDPAHPDGKAGLSVLFGAQTSLGWLVMAAATALAGNLWTETILTDRSVTDYGQLLASFVLLAPLVVLAPLFAFSAPLERARQRFHEHYGAASADFAARYARAWIEEGSRAALPLGSGETSTHADLVTSFDRVTQLDWIPFRKRDYLTLLVAAAIPLLAFMLHRLPLMELLLRLKGALS